jgi:hypothetical protein
LESGADGIGGNRVHFRESELRAMSAAALLCKRLPSTEDTKTGKEEGKCCYS